MKPLVKNRICLIFLGKKGGAVPYSFEFTKEYLNTGGKILCILSEYIDNKNQWELLKKDCPNLSLFFIKTYLNKHDFLFSFFKNKWITNVLNQIKLFNPQAIYIPMMSLLVERLIKKLRNYTIITTIHDFYQHPGMINPIRKLLFDRIINNSNKIIVLTRSFIPLVEKKYKFNKENIFHIPHPNFNYYNKENEIPDFSIKNNLLFFGRITKYKGLNILLEAMPKIWQMFPNINLTIVGRGQLTKYEEEFIDKNKNRVKLINWWIKDSEVWDYFQKSDLTILPYIEASQSGVVSLSFSCGRNVVATDVGGLKEQITPAKGIVVAPNDSNAISNAIIKLYKKPDYIIEINKYCYEYAQKELTWRSAVRKFLDI